ncbi:MAG TPA: peptidylprolyl isomerase [Ignavibacteriaceae bacterium]|nr:peptidylprolyl isomerase [Ignavibacteriaceae bacterium]
MGSKKYILFFILIAPALLFAQYTKNDRALVKTTFERSFDKQIINNYLESNNSQKINAALLSIAQSEDTTFIDSITKLDFNNNARFICFALGQIGSSRKSADYLLTKFNDKNTADSNKPYLIKALGKTGDLNDFKILESGYKISNKDFDGISIAIYDFFVRKIITKDMAVFILEKELNGKSLLRAIDAAFAIARLGLSDHFEKTIYKFLSNGYSSYYKNEERLVFMQYLMENLRRANYVLPYGYRFFIKLLYLPNPLMKTEAAAMLAYYQYKTKDDIQRYLRFFDDENQNVTRQAAISIKEISLKPELSDFLKGKMEQLIHDTSLSGNTRGELLLSYVKIYKQNLKSVLEKFSKNVNQEFIFKVALNDQESEFAFNYAVDKFNVLNGKEKINALSTVLGFNNFSNTEKFNKAIFSSLESGYPVLIALAAYGIDSTFIAKNSEELQKYLSNIVSRHKDDAQFIESLQSVAGISGQISKSFEEKILTQLSKSDIYIIRKYANEKLRLKTENSNANAELFDRLWKDAFKYSSSTVKTSKGDFTINFTPELAPISVGNFCNLASQKYFNGIIFHRVVPSFVIQGGDPTGTGWGGPDYTIVSEFSPLHYSISAVGMASAGKDTEGSQWFVTLGDFPHLDGRYSIFGYVTSGMDTVYMIDQYDKINSVELNH